MCRFKVAQRFLDAAYVVQDGHKEGIVVTVQVDEHSKRVHKEGAGLLQQLHVEREKSHVVDASGGYDAAPVKLFCNFNSLSVCLKCLVVATLPAHYSST